jgi:hypothetical protein
MSYDDWKLATPPEYDEPPEEPPAMDVVLPDSDDKLRAEGWRLHVFREHDEGNVYLSSERVLPEKVADPDARRIIDSRRILLHPDEVAWLHARLGELLPPALSPSDRALIDHALGVLSSDYNSVDHEAIAELRGRVKR